LVVVREKPTTEDNIMEITYHIDSTVYNTSRFILTVVYAPNTIGEVIIHSYGFSMKASAEEFMADREDDDGVTAMEMITIAD
jgi:hypothetical protein